MTPRELLASLERRLTPAERSQYSGPPEEMMAQLAESHLLSTARGMTVEQIAAWYQRDASMSSHPATVVAYLAYRLAVADLERAAAAFFREQRSWSAQKAKEVARQQSAARRERMREHSAQLRAAGRTGTYSRAAGRSSTLEPR